MTPEFPLDIEQGASFSNTFNWYGGGKAMAPIEEIVVGYPTIIKATAHGLPTNSDTPMILSGIAGAEILNSSDLGIEEAVFIDVDHYSMPVSTVRHIWVVGSGEMTWYRPSDITNFTARMHIREKWYSAAFIHELTTENGGITLTVEDASILLEISAVDTAAFTFNQAFYDVELISPAGVVTRVFKGVITLIKEITK